MTETFRVLNFCHLNPSALLWITSFRVSDFVFHLPDSYLFVCQIAGRVIRPVFILNKTCNNIVSRYLSFINFFYSSEQAVNSVLSRFRINLETEIF